MYQLKDKINVTEQAIARLADLLQNPAKYGQKMKDPLPDLNFDILLLKIIKILNCCAHMHTHTNMHKQAQTQAKT